MRTSKEIFDQTNELARMFYRALGYTVKPGYNFYDATHPKEVMCWDMACEAQLLLTDTDIENVLSDLEE